MEKKSVKKIECPCNKYVSEIFLLDNGEYFEETKPIETDPDPNPDPNPEPKPKIDRKEWQGFRFPDPF